MANLVLVLFCAGLLLCVFTGKSVLYALFFGLAMFLLYARKQGFSVPELREMSLSGIKTAKNVIINFIFIGMLTASWRSAGTIAVIVCSFTKFIKPDVFLLMAFLLCSGVSFLTGSSFATAATMGVICTTMGNTMGISLVLSGGAVISGCYFGDRLSPVSTSALLVSEITKTNLFDNLKLMARDSIPACAATSLIYLVMGFVIKRGDGGLDLEEIFSRDFSLSPIAVLPVIVLLAMAFKRCNMKLTMGVSILTALPICILVQHRSAAEAAITLWSGFKTHDPQLAAMINGGGIASMIRLMVILCLASAYSGIFRQTGMLKGLKSIVEKMARRLTPFGATYITASLAAAVSCNQTLDIFITQQLCEDLYSEPGDFMISLEDSCILSAAYWPWNIAAATPLASVGAPNAAILAAVYLFAIPISRWIRVAIKAKVTAKA